MESDHTEQNSQFEGVFFLQKVNGPIHGDARHVLRRSVRVVYDFLSFGKHGKKGIVWLPSGSRCPHDVGLRPCDTPRAVCAVDGDDGRVEEDAAAAFARGAVTLKAVPCARGVAGAGGAEVGSGAAAIALGLEFGECAVFARGVAHNAAPDVITQPPSAAAGVCAGVVPILRSVFAEEAAAAARCGHGHAVVCVGQQRWGRRCVDDPAKHDEIPVQDGGGLEPLCVALHINRLPRTRVQFGAEELVP